MPELRLREMGAGPASEKEGKTYDGGIIAGNPDLAIPLAKYIDSTGRFKTKSGERTQTRNHTSTQETHNR